MLNSRLIFPEENPTSTKSNLMLYHFVDIQLKELELMQAKLAGDYRLVIIELTKEVLGELYYLYPYLSRSEQEHLVMMAHRGYYQSQKGIINKNLLNASNNSETDCVDSSEIDLTNVITRLLANQAGRLAEAVAAGMIATNFIKPTKQADLVSRWLKEIFELALTTPNLSDEQTARLNSTNPFPVARVGLPTTLELIAGWMRGSFDLRELHPIWGELFAGAFLRQMRKASELNVQQQRRTSISPMETPHLGSIEALLAPQREELYIEA